MIRHALIASLLLGLAACSQPAPEIPLETAAVAPTPAVAAAGLRAVVDPCATALDRARGDIGLMAASGQARPAARAAAVRAKDACAGAFIQIEKAKAPGDARDACLSAVYTRETLVDTALQLIDGKAGALAGTTLRYKADDQAAAARACDAAIAQLGGREYAMAASPSRQ